WGFEPVFPVSKADRLGAPLVLVGTTASQAQGEVESHGRFAVGRCTQALGRPRGQVHDASRQLDSCPRPLEATTTRWPAGSFTSPSARAGPRCRGGRSRCGP